MLRKYSIKKRTDSKLADDFRKRKLKHNLFTNILISNQVFIDVYSTEKMYGLVSENCKRTNFKILKNYLQTKKQIT